MNEVEKVIEENLEKPQEELLDIVSSDTVSGGDSPFPDAGNTLEKLDHNTVSGGDTVPASPLGTNGMVQALVFQDAESVQSLAGYVASLDFKVSCILFLLLFIWCEKKIRNAVRNMTGKGGRN